MSTPHDPHDPEGRWVDLDPVSHAGRRLGGGRVHVTEEGDPAGKTILCVHGAPGSVRDFRYLGPELAARGFHVVRVDMPGFGVTEKDVWPDVSARGRAGFICHLARSLKLQLPVVLGHSAGCPPCLVAAAWFPDRIAGVVLVNTPGITRHRGMQVPEPLSFALGRLLMFPSVGDKILAEARRGYKRGGFRDSEVDKLDKSALKTHTEIVSGLNFPLLRGAARKLATPALVVSARDDKLIEESVPIELVGALKTRVVHLHFKEGGHYLQKFKAPEIADAARELFV